MHGHERVMIKSGERDAGKTISVFSQATIANLNDPYRQGNVIFLPRQGDIIISADIHGNVDNFKRIVEKADLENNNQRHCVFQELIHGSKETIRDGDNSFILLEWLAALKIKYPAQVHILLGNHDHAEIAKLPIIKHGGFVLPLMHSTLKETYGRSYKEVKGALMRFFRSFPLAARTAFGVFISHSTPEAENLNFFDMSIFERSLSDEDYKKDRSVFHLVWGRDTSGKTAATFASLMNAEVLVIGHNPCENGYAVPNKYEIIIDCKDENGCYILMPLDKHLTLQEIIDHIIYINHLEGNPGGF